jgi:flavin-dependent dehydrogenase
LDVAAALDPNAIKRGNGLGRVAAGIISDAGFPEVPGLDRLPWHGTPSLTRRPTRVAADRLFLVGDAAGYIEPFTGEGIACALDCGSAVAPLLISAAENWHAELARSWTRLHRRIVARRTLPCRCITTALRHHHLARLFTSVLALAPGLASPVIHMLNAEPRWT